MIKKWNTMGMTAIVQIEDLYAQKKDIQEIANYFRHIDNVFSTYKKTSEYTNQRA